MLTMLMLHQITLFVNFLTVAGVKAQRLMFFCRTLPVTYIVDQRRILFYKKLKCNVSALSRVIAKTMSS